MTDAPNHASEPTRLDRAITWTGVGSATALAALLIMFGVWGFASSAPRADNVGEEGIGIVFGVFGWAAGIAVALVAGRALARRAHNNRWTLRALPLLAGIAWMLLASAALYGRWFEGVVFGAFGAFDWLPTALSLMLWPLFVQSVYSVGALPICLGLLVAFLVLVALRARRRTDGRGVAPTGHAQQRPDVARP